MQRKWWQVVLVGSATLASASGSWAACEPFTAPSPWETREMNFGDMDGDGAVSVGDKRVGERALTDADGNEIGKRYWVATVEEVTADGKAQLMSVENTNVFDDGAIFATYGHRDSEVQFDTAEETTLTRRSHTFAIVGGTGAYAGARGTVEFTPDDDGNNEYRFNLSCE